jgi:hypothetical protein
MPGPTPETKVRSEAEQTETALLRQNLEAVQQQNAMLLEVLGNFNTGDSATAKELNQLRREMAGKYMKKPSEALIEAVTPNKAARPDLMKLIYDKKDPKGGYGPWKKDPNFDFNFGAADQQMYEEQLADIEDVDADEDEDGEASVEEEKVTKTGFLSRLRNAFAERNKLNLFTFRNRAKRTASRIAESADFKARQALNLAKRAVGKDTYVEKRNMETYAAVSLFFKDIGFKNITTEQALRGAIEKYARFGKKGLKPETLADLKLLARVMVELQKKKGINSKAHRHFRLPEDAQINIMEDGKEQSFVLADYARQACDPTIPGGLLDFFGENETLAISDPSRRRNKLEIAHHYLVNNEIFVKALLVEGDAGEETELDLDEDESEEPENGPLINIEDLAGKDAKEIADEVNALYAKLVPRYSKDETRQEKRVRELEEKKFQLGVLEKLLDVKEIADPEVALQYLQNLKEVFTSEISVKNKKYPLLRGVRRDEVPGYLKDIDALIDGLKIKQTKDEQRDDLPPDPVEIFKADLARGEDEIKNGFARIQTELDSIADTADRDNQKKTLYEEFLEHLNSISDLVEKHSIDKSLAVSHLKKVSAVLLSTAGDGSREVTLFSSEQVDQMQQAIRSSLEKLENSDDVIRIKSERMDTATFDKAKYLEQLKALKDISDPNYFEGDEREILDDEGEVTQIFAAFEVVLADASSKNPENEAIAIRYLDSIRAVALKVIKLKAETAVDVSDPDKVEKQRLADIAKEIIRQLSS